MVERVEQSALSPRQIFYKIPDCELPERQSQSEMAADLKSQIQNKLQMLSL